MTENEAIEIIKYASAFNNDNSPLTKALEVANQALEEIQQYRAIGTVEECKTNKVLADKGYKFFMDDIELLKEYRAIGTIEELKALKEKSVAKKPNQVSKAMDKDKYVGLIGRCPNCSSIVAEDNLVCEDCFQVLDWSE